MIIVGISGSPTGGSSTDLLINAILEGVSAPHVKTRFIKLNDLNILPCQACGKSPEPNYCFFQDDMDNIYSLMAKADAIILGSPVYFDSISAQAKIFIDRTNCLRPLDFSVTDETRFKKPLFEGKKGGFVLVGGNKFETAARTARAFFIWAGIERVFEMNYISVGNEIGSVRLDAEALDKARNYGKELLSAISKN
jgi:multimeric flavodoxin WrbA